MKKIMRPLLRFAALAGLLLWQGAVWAAIDYHGTGTGTTAGPAVGYRGVGTLDTQTGNGSITPGLPAGTAAGDLLVLVVLHSGGDGQITAPSGWSTVQGGGNNGQNIAGAVFYRIAPAGATAPTVNTPSNDADTLLMGRVMSFTNVNMVPSMTIASSSINLSNNDATTNASQVTGSTTGSSMVVVTSHINDNCSDVGDPSSGSWERAFASSVETSSSSVADGAIAAHYRLQTSASGSTQPAVSIQRSGCTNDDAYGIQFVIRWGGGLTIPVPVATEAGDVMVATLATRPSGSSFSAPTGWTEGLPDSTQTFGETARMATYWRVATNSEPTSYTWGLTGTATGGATGAIASFSGVDPVAPIHVYGTRATGNGYEHAAPSVTTTVANTLLLTSHIFTSTTSNWSPPSGMTEIADIASMPRPDQFGLSMSLNRQAIAAVGATGPREADASSFGTNSAYGIARAVALRPATPVTVHHYELRLPATSLACMPNPVTVVACSSSDTPCTGVSNTVNGQSVLLGASAGTLADTQVTFANNSGAFTTLLSYPAAPNNTNVTVTMSNHSAPPQAANYCCVGTTCTQGNSCATNFRTAGFIFASTNTGGPVDLSSQIAGNGSATYYLRAVRSNTTTAACEGILSGSKSVDFAYECDSNPSTCAGSNLMTVTPDGGSATAISRNDNDSISSFQPITLNFDANGSAPFSFAYGDVGRVRLWARKQAGSADTPTLLTTLSTTSNDFVIKPYDFSFVDVSNNSEILCGATANPAATDARGAKFCAAGDAFSAKIRARTATGATVPSFGRCDGAGGTDCAAASEQVTMAHTLVAPAAADGGMPGSLGDGTTVVNASSFVAGTGSYSIGNLKWSEVGIIKLKVSNDNYLGNSLAACGSNPAPGDACRGTYGLSGNVGRFYPKYFLLEITPEPNCTGFVYGGHVPESGAANVLLGQPFTVKATAKSGLSPATTTENYRYYSPALADVPRNFARNVNLTLTDGDTEGNLYVAAVQGGNNAIPAAKFNAPTTPGVGVVAHNDANPISYVFNAFNVSGNLAAPAPTVIKLHADDADSATSAATGEASTMARLGRLRLANAFGSERVPLAMSVRTEYWSGKSWIVNSDDSCTTLTSGNFHKIPSSATLAAVTASNVTINTGRGVLTLSAPGANNVGTIDIAANLGASGNSLSCLSTNGGTSGNRPWLRSRNGSCASTYDRDPSARATFGIYAPESRRLIDIREY